MFRELSPEEETSFRQWARDNYTPGEEIRIQVWHPVVVEECHEITREYEQRRQPQGDQP